MKAHHYSTTIIWNGNTGTGTLNYQSYERSHVISTPNKIDIHSSSDPSFRGDPSKHNPEELFLASLSSCHMLWYLHLCAINGVVVTSYIDKAKGVMQETENGGGHFISVTLYPLVEVKEKSMVNKALELHKRANELCFIANSCNFKISHEPTCLVNQDS